MQLMMRKQILGDLSITLGDLGGLTLKQVQQNQHLTLLCSDIPLTAKVDVYGGVMSRNCSLISIGDFVKFSDSGTSAMVQT